MCAGGRPDIGEREIACAPCLTALHLRDVNRIPNRATRVIMIVDLFYCHEDLLSVTRNFAQKTAGAIALPTNRAEQVEYEPVEPVRRRQGCGGVCQQLQTTLVRTCRSLARLNFGI